MKRSLKLWVDQNGNRIFAATLRELLAQSDGGRISKMYVDGNDGKTYHVGYVIGRQWFDCFIPLRNEV